MTALMMLTAVLLLDAWLGEPRRWHPLVGFGRYAQWLERNLYAPRYSRGVLALLCAIAPVSLLLLNRSFYSAWSLLIDTVLLYFCIAHQSLTAHARPIAVALKQQDLPRARQLTGYIVSRDTEQADAEALTKASIESVLENGNDAVFAAMFWFLLLGVPGAVLFRLANTLDAMWGYRNPRYLKFGWAAARFDDVLNFIPARLTALTYVLLGHLRCGWQCWRTQAASWKSPNAGPVMSAGAGALQVCLGGAACYHGVVQQRPLLGMGVAPVVDDIERALRLVRRGVFLWVLSSWSLWALYQWVNAA